MLEALDLSLELSKTEYERQFKPLRQQLHRLQRACWEANLATMVVFEGWDAAGKGTTIRKLTQRLEPRGFALHLIRKPRTFEKQMPWLWRYWLKVPNWGQMAIFDRSWCGRVLVAKVEGLISPREGRRSYADIVNFERTLADDRYAVVKFFLHISKEEQRKRFQTLEEDPLTAWQVEPEDWDHHERYDDYRTATEQMLQHTETEWGPWTLVEATNKYWTRIKVFETLIAAMESNLQKFDIEAPQLDRRELDEEDDED